MLLILAIDIVVVLVLVVAFNRRGLEAALPYFAFFVTLLPEECRIPLPGLFDLYGHRLALVLLVVFFFASNARNTGRALPLKNLILLHTGWALFSTLTSIVILTSAKQLLSQVLEYYLVYYIFFKTVTSVRTIWKIAFAMVAAMSVASIFGLIEIYRG